MANKKQESAPVATEPKPKRTRRPSPPVALQYRADETAVWEECAITEGVVLRSDADARKYLRKLGDGCQAGEYRTAGPAIVVKATKITKLTIG